MGSTTTVIILFFIFSVMIDSNEGTLEISKSDSNMDSSKVKELLGDSIKPSGSSAEGHDQLPNHSQCNSRDEESGHGQGHDDGHGSNQDDNKCEKYTTGPDCTDLSKSNCSWCFQEIFKFPRCDSYNHLLKKGCGEDLIYNDYYEYQTRVIDLNDPNPIPEVRLPLMLTKCGSVKSFDIKVNWTQPPMDFYVVMDVSGSMRDDKPIIVGLSSQLIEFIQTLSNDYRIGFGAFSDRVPIDAFTYKNVLPLTADVSLFPTAVTNAPILFGFDFPEDAGTGIYESLICKEQIGWRPMARRFLMILTDDIFHTANDGAIDIWNATAIDFDGLCHLDGSGVYTEAMKQDYPSMEQLTKLILESQVNSIFGIVKDPEFYSNLMPLIPPAVYGNLSSDSSNLIQLFQTAYGDLVSSVDMVFSPTLTPGVTIQLFSTCNTGVETETSHCEGLPLEGTVKFRVQVTMTSCPLDPNARDYNVRISAKGIPKEVDAHVQLVC